MLSRNCTTFGPASSGRYGSRYISETRNGRAVAAQFNMTCTFVTNFRVRASRAKSWGCSIEHLGVIVIMGDRQVSRAHRDLQGIDLCAGWDKKRLSSGPNF